jgi:hypothetical protein
MPLDSSVVGSILAIKFTEGRKRFDAILDYNYMVYEPSQVPEKETPDFSNPFIEGIFPHAIACLGTEQSGPVSQGIRLAAGFLGESRPRSLIGYLTELCMFGN